jgi:hypothetical protein
MIKRTAHFDEIIIPNSFFKTKEVTLRRTPLMFYRAIYMWIFLLTWLKIDAQ